jgi:tetratricopeptide (TPR) repeat protein
MICLLRLLPQAISQRVYTLVGLLSFLLVAGSLGGCLGAEIEANARQLQAQQGELDRLKEEIAAIRNTQASYPSAASAGTCDTGVMRKATLRGGEAFAGGEFGRALGYYEDALTACPRSAEAELNVARAHEAQGERQAAISHYAAAGNAAGASDASIAKQARDALERLRATK